MPINTKKAILLKSIVCSLFGDSQSPIFSCVKVEMGEINWREIILNANLQKIKTSCHSFADGL